MNDGPWQRDQKGNLDLNNCNKNNILPITRNYSLTGAVMGVPKGKHVIRLGVVITLCSAF